MTATHNNATVTTNDCITLRVRSHDWRPVNPFSILRQFDQWFDFECQVRGLRKGVPLVTTWGTNA